MFSKRIYPRLALTLFFAGATFGCTFEEGSGFSTLEGGSVSSQLVPGARDLGNRTLITDLGYRVRLATANLEITEVVLAQRVGGAESGGSFDPANPPLGYSLCHGGHCHAADGRLVDYADIEAELAGGAPSFVPLVTLPIDVEMDWFAGELFPFESVVPSRELPRAEIAKVSVRLAKLTLVGEISGGPEPGGLGTTTASFSATLEPPPPFEHAYAWSIDRDAPETVRIDVAAITDGTLFDEIDFANRVENGGVSLTDVDDADLVRLSAHLASTEIFDPAKRLIVDAVRRPSNECPATPQLGGAMRSIATSATVSF